MRSAGNGATRCDCSVDRSRRIAPLTALRLTAYLLLLNRARNFDSILKGESCARLEGSRFGTYPKDHTFFATALAGPQTWLNKRLPQTSRRVIRRPKILVLPIFVPKGL
jgi:hypothetical protein